MERPDIPWREISASSIRTFQMGEEPELIHLIKTGHVLEETYIVVSEDAYDYDTGKTSIKTKEEIEEVYGIKL